MRRERGERDRDGFALAAAVGEGEREKRSDGVVELVRRLLALGRQQRKALLDVAEVAERARQLDHGPATSDALEPECKRLAVERNGAVGRPVESEAHARSNAATGLFGGSSAASSSTFARQASSSNSSIAAQSASDRPS
jgi:hypothetical protein